MTPFERMHAACHKPFDFERNNCAHAALAALRHREKARAAFRAAAAAELSGVLVAAEHAAAAAGCYPAGITGEAFGVCNVRAGHTLCARIDTAWWRRGKRGAARVKPTEILKAWAV
jgi:hypothetical protein